MLFGYFEDDAWSYEIDANASLRRACSSSLESNLNPDFSNLALVALALLIINEIKCQNSSHA